MSNLFNIRQTSKPTQGEIQLAMLMERLHKREKRLLEIEAGGGSDRGVYYGGGRVDANIPVGGLNINPFVEMGGAYGEYKTPWGDFPVRQFQIPEYGVNAEYKVRF